MTIELPFSLSCRSIRAGPREARIPASSLEYTFWAFEGIQGVLYTGTLLGCLEVVEYNKEELPATRTSQALFEFPTAWILNMSEVG
jgi:hypothetical protein